MKRKIVRILLFSFILLFLTLCLMFVAYHRMMAKPTADKGNIKTESPTVEASENIPSENKNELSSESSVPTEEPTQKEEVQTEEQQLQNTQEHSAYSDEEEFATETLSVSEPMITYTVSLFDYNDTPVTETLTVRLVKNEQTVASVKTENGIATFSLPPDVYTVAIDFGQSSSFFYDSNDPIQLAEYVPAIMITLHNRSLQASEIVNAYSVEHNAFIDFVANEIGVGHRYVEATPEERTYFLFTPTEEGQYEISLDTAYAHWIGHFGTPSFARQDSISETTDDNSFLLNVKPSNIGATYLLGITSYEESLLPCTVKILRIGHAILDADDVQAEEIKAQNLPDASFHEALGNNATVTDLAIDDPELSVILNREDGFYHLQTLDGPIVYMHLTTKSAYLDPLEAVATKATLNRYFYDESGSFTHKEQYNTIFLDYAAVAHPASGLVPLTEELANAIKNVGEGMEWWKFGSQNYLFGMTAVSPNTAWLFACCTIE